jgi:hypothetical protein
LGGKILAAPLTLALFPLGGGRIVRRILQIKAIGNIPELRL